MFDYLVDHALKNVWCTPNQDMQTIVKPARLTSATGAFNTVRIQWRDQVLPVAGARFHVYQIGQLHPLLMGLFPQQNSWMTLAETCGLQSLVVDLYSSSGLQLPRHQAWYMVTEDKNLVLAVRDQPKIAIQQGTEDIFLRVYSNAYFHSARANAATDIVYVNGKTVTSNDDILALQNDYLTRSQQAGCVYAFVNGQRVESFSLLNVKAGDVVEYVFDGSVLKVLDFPLANLPSFVSTLDSKHKYLLHYVGVDDGVIEYHDDIDVFVLVPDSTGRKVGLYYHRNQADAVRMVTHRDYAIPVPYVDGYLTALNASNQTAQAVVRLHIRKSGYQRALVNETNRIKELYKLNDADISGALLGVNSTVPNWRAETLEQAAYTQIMRSRGRDVTSALVQQAYGYNAMSKLLCDTPRYTRLYSGQMIVDVPYGLQTRAMGYEYDSNGKLLGVFSHSSGSTYAARVFQTALVEMLTGFGTNELDEVYGENTQTLDPTASYRMYVCPKIAGEPTNVWQDVTSTSQYAIENNVLTWLIDTSQYYTLVRSDKQFLAYSVDLPLDAGVLKFSLTHEQRRNGVLSNYVMQVPQGELEVFLNGYSLIENIDYVAQFPEIVILNKSYLVNPDTDAQHIDVRFTGFCNSDLSWNVPSETGFIQYDLLSHNNRFDLRDDKVMRIVVGGKCMERSQLKFAESNSGVTVPNGNNGLPYVIRDIVTPLRGMVTEDTYALRAASQVIDKAVSDYMSLKLPQPVIATPSAITALYQVVSPFACKILYDLISGVLNDPRIKQHYNDMDVMDICKPYEDLLRFDPTQDNTAADLDYTVIHPHPLPTQLEIDIYYYTFLARVNRLYLHDKVVLSSVLSLTPGP